MPRFYFDLQHECDTVGSELRDAAAARRLARRYAGELLRDAREETGQAYWRLDVRQGSGPVIFSVVLELLPVRAPHRRASARSKRHREGEELV